MPEIKSTMEVSIPAWIDVRPHYGIEIISVLQGRLTIPKEEVSETLLTGSTRIEKEADVEYSFPCRIKIEQKSIQSDILQGFLTLENYYPIDGYNLLQGKVSLSKEKSSVDILRGNVHYVISSSNDLLTGRLNIKTEELVKPTGSGTEENPSTGEDDIQEIITIPKDPTNPYGEKISRHKYEFNGSLSYDKEFHKEDLLQGHAYIARYEKLKEIEGHVRLLNTILEDTDSEVEVPKDPTNPYSGTVTRKTYEINGSFNYERGSKVVDLYAKCTLSKDDVVSDLLQGTLTYEKGEESIDLLKGSLNIAGYYSAADFPCRIKVNKRELVHSIFSRINVPPQRSLEIPCHIEVDGENCVNQIILEGKVELLKEDVSVDLLQGNVILLPTIHADIDCHAKLNAVHTRREFDASINVVHGYKFELPSTITIEPSGDYWFYQEILNCRIRVGKNYSTTLPSTIQVHGEKKVYSTLPKPPKARIAIVVSPTWRYETFVFKSSLITFLDRYYRKVNLEIVFSGSPRADFDIINLAMNYRIPRENVLNVPIEVDFHNRDRMQASVDHFIHHMITDSKGQQIPISRVFVFMNQPSWYYSDPVGKIPDFCKYNNISCVCIDSGGEYHEMMKIDQARDAALSQLEWDRQQRIHPNYTYDNVRLPNVDPNRIVY